MFFVLFILFFVTRLTQLYVVRVGCLAAMMYSSSVTCR